MKQTILLLIICWNALLVCGGRVDFQDIVDQYCNSSSAPIRVRKGKAGPRGPSGSPGVRGRPGPPGPAGMADMIAVADLIQKKVDRGLQQVRQSLVGTINRKMAQLTADVRALSELYSLQNRRQLFLAQNPGWEFTGSNLLFKKFTESVDYRTAEERCGRYRGGRLASRILRDPMAVRRMITLGYPSPASWIGYTDRQREGTWQWADSGTTNTLTSWRPGEPNSYEGTDEDCVEITSSASGTTLLMNDLRCDERFRNYICEIEL